MWISGWILFIVLIDIIKIISAFFFLFNHNHHLDIITIIVTTTSFHSPYDIVLEMVVTSIS